MCMKRYSLDADAGVGYTAVKISTVHTADSAVREAFINISSKDVHKIRELIGRAGGSLPVNIHLPDER